VLRRAAPKSVEPRGKPIQPAVRPAEQYCGRGVGFVDGEHHLPRTQQLARPDRRGVHAGSLGEMVDRRALIAAPGKMDGPELACAESESRRADHGEERGVMSRATAA
jgi:hypothetical protein